MNNFRFPVGLSIVLLALGFPMGCQQVAEKPPNIIFFLADDLGYGELGVYGQKIIQTPHIDALAANGMRFTQHYSGAPVCAPARCVFLTGYHTGHAFIRGNDEWAERGDVWNYAAASANPQLEGQRPLPEGTITLGNQLKSAGYRTGIIGKWGLGAPESDGIPNLQGFDYFYGYNCQRQAHNLYPVHLWENTKKVALDNELVAPRTKLEEGCDIYEDACYAHFRQKEYAPKLMQDEALAFIRRNKDQPFFMYYASPLPHLPLQAPKEDVDRYREIFGEEEPYIGDKGYFPNRYPRATYAAMISYIDKQIGELIATLKELDLYENTIVIFSSDNGPTYIGGVDFEYFNSAGPFPNQYGRTKGFTYEGGIRVPLIASWPGKIKPGSVNDHISAFYDMMPTFCDLAGVAPPKDIDGKSFKPTLLGLDHQETHEFLYWEFPSYGGQQAVRMGDWKGIRKDIFKGNMELELYNLKTDPQESANLAEQHPDMVSQILQIMKQEHRPSPNERFKFKELGDL